MAEKITSEGHAKKQQERALEILREVREYVNAQCVEFVTSTDDPVSKHSAEAYGAYAVWYDRA